MRIAKSVLSTTNPNTARQEITWVLLRSPIGSALLQSPNCIIWMLPAAYLLLSLFFSSQKCCPVAELEAEDEFHVWSMGRSFPCSHLCLMTESAGQCRRETMPTFFGIIFSICRSAHLCEAENVSPCFPKYSRYRLLAEVASDSSYFSSFVLLLCYNVPVSLVMYSFTHADVLGGEREGSEGTFWSMNSAFSLASTGHSCTSYAHMQGIANHIKEEHQSRHSMQITTTS